MSDVIRAILETKDLMLKAVADQVSILMAKEMDAISLARKYLMPQVLTPDEDGFTQEVTLQFGHASNLNETSMAYLLRTGCQRMVEREEQVLLERMVSRAGLVFAYYDIPTTVRVLGAPLTHDPVKIPSMPGIEMLVVNAHRVPDVGMAPGFQASPPYAWRVGDIGTLPGMTVVMPMTSLNVLGDKILGLPNPVGSILKIGTRSPMVTLSPEGNAWIVSQRISVSIDPTIRPVVLEPTRAS